MFAARHRKILPLHLLRSPPPISSSSSSSSFSSSSALSRASTTTTNALPTAPNNPHHLIQTFETTDKCTTVSIVGGSALGTRIKGSNVVPLGLILCRGTSYNRRIGWFSTMVDPGGGGGDGDNSDTNPSSGSGNDDDTAMEDEGKDTNMVVKEDETLKPQWKKLSEVPISEVLKKKYSDRWIEPIIHRNATVRETIQVCIDNGLSGMMVVDDAPTTISTSTTTSDDLSASTTSTSTLARTTTSSSTKKSKSETSVVLGLSTARDLLRVMNKGFKDGENVDEILEKKVGNFMTPIGQVIYARPEETIGTCRAIIAKLGVKCLPILSSGRVEGIVTARDMSQYGLEAADQGGKRHYLESTSRRVGLLKTSMAEPPTYLKEHLAKDGDPLYSNIGIAELPHPFKGADGCGMNRRDFGPGEVSRDISLSEDSHFTLELSSPETNSSSESHQIIYAGVADGVGSWREYGVDPREFSHRLMSECANVLREFNCTKLKNTAGGCGTGSSGARSTPAPADVMDLAYERVRADNVIGSSTACVARFDGLRHQLQFSNLGDCGVVVLRHIDSDVAGSLKRERRIPRALRTDDLRVNFVSQQQLRSFNHPFQLGWTGEDPKEGEKLFEKASESCTSSIHIRRGDIIIIGTDGLFDNVELEDVTAIAIDWERKNRLIEEGGMAEWKQQLGQGISMTQRSAAAVNDLAKALVEKARENSLDSSKDSPFAILAKENDVMWTGGMPDDCTVIAMHIVGAMVR